VLLPTSLSVRPRTQFRATESSCATFPILDEVPFASPPHRQDNSSFPESNALMFQAPWARPESPNMGVLACPLGASESTIRPIEMTCHRDRSTVPLRHLCRLAPAESQRLAPHQEANLDVAKASKSRWSTRVVETTTEPFLRRRNAASSWFNTRPDSNAPSNTD
jgi:hypothetical protein